MGWTVSLAAGTAAESGLRLVGDVHETDRAGATCLRTNPAAPEISRMGYWRGEPESTTGPGEGVIFSVEDPPDSASEVFAVIDFFEDRVGWLALEYRVDNREAFAPYVCTWHESAPREDTWVSTADTSTMQRVVFRLSSPVFGNGERGDLRITGDGPVFVAGVTLTDQQPDGMERHTLTAHAERIHKILSPRFPDPAMPFSVGNICAIFEDGDLRNALDVVPMIPIYRAMGVSAIQSYVRWSSVEKDEGVWDWTCYDWVVEKAKAFGMRWVAFIMIGPHYAMPKWWLEVGNDRKNRCLEHGEESWVQSIWSDAMLPAVERFMQAFAAHYPEQIVESVMLGPAGDFGETTTNGVFTRGLYHTHVGYWCGEDAAVEDLRRTMEERYGSIERLNEEWHTEYASFEELRPVQRHEAASLHQWTEQVGWYVDRMTWWTEEWGRITRSALPYTPVYIAAGGAGDPPRAATWSGQMRVLKPSNVGARVTNEGGDYAFNFAYTSWAGVCCDWWGLPFGNEPWGGDMSGNGVLGRIFNAITLGADNFWIYDGHMRSDASRKALEAGLPYLDGTVSRANRVAVYYPWTHFVVNDEHGFSEKGLRDIFWPQVEELRDILDFDLVDDGLVAEGILRNYDFLIVLQGTVYEHGELERLAEWVRRGGVLVTHNIGLPGTVDGDISVGQELMNFPLNPTRLELELDGRIAAIGHGRVVMHTVSADMKGWYGDSRWEGDHKDHPSTKPSFWGMIIGTLSRASELGTGLDDYPILDGERDEVYVSFVEYRGVDGALFFSQRKDDVTKRVTLPGGATGEMVVPAGGLAFLPLA